MTESNRCEEQSERVELNDIAEHLTETGTLPKGISRSYINKLGEALYESLAEPIEACSDSGLTRREAEVWVLTNFVERHHVRLTDAAIALLIATPGSPFGEEVESTPVENIALAETISEIEDRYERAEEKYERAKQLVGTVPFRAGDEHLVSPRSAWLDSSTLDRIQERLKGGEMSLEAVITRLLDETETRLSLEEFIQSYLRAAGRDNVAQVAVDSQSLETETLTITAHTSANTGRLEVLSETDTITIGDREYRFRFEEVRLRPYTGEDRLSVYVADDIVGMDGVQVTDGVERVVNSIREAK